jgi:hypothetical protein
MEEKVLQQLAIRFWINPGKNLGNALMNVKFNVEF